MLVLSRKVGEEILIGDTIRVRILEIRGNRVKLGFTAPDNVRFARYEITRGRAECDPDDYRTLAHAGS